MCEHVGADEARVALALVLVPIAIAIAATVAMEITGTRPEAHIHGTPCPGCVRAVQAQETRPPSAHRGEYSAVGWYRVSPGPWLRSRP